MRANDMKKVIKERTETAYRISKRIEEVFGAGSEEDKIYSAMWSELDSLCRKLGIEYSI